MPSSEIRRVWRLAELCRETGGWLHLRANRGDLGRRGGRDQSANSPYLARKLGNQMPLVPCSDEVRQVTVDPGLVGLAPPKVIAPHFVRLERLILARLLQFPWRSLLGFGRERTASSWASAKSFPGA